MIHSRGPRLFSLTHESKGMHDVKTTKESIIVGNAAAHTPTSGTYVAIITAPAHEAQSPTPLQSPCLVHCEWNACCHYGRDWAVCLFVYLSLQSSGSIGKSTSGSYPTTPADPTVIKEVTSVDFDPGCGRHGFWPGTNPTEEDQRLATTPHWPRWEARGLL